MLQPMNFQNKQLLLQDSCICPLPASLCPCSPEQRLPTPIAAAYQPHQQQRLIMPNKQLLQHACNTWLLQQPSN
jgi:hypothetical protein